MRTERKRITSVVGVWLMIFLLGASLAACGSSSGRSDDKAEATTSTEAAPPMADSDAESKATADTATTNTSAAEEPSQPTSGIADTSTQADFQRQVIYTANLQMQVKDFASTRSAIDQMITSSGGYLLSFSESESSNQQRGSFKIKVPAKGFDSFIDAIDKLPDKKLSKSINGEDVTEEYADLTARLKAKEVAEARLLSFMENAKTSKDLVAFSNELAQVQEEIERIKGRMRFIDQNVEYSTINIDMYQNLSSEGAELADLDEKPSLLTTAGDALHKSADIIVEVGKAIVIVAAFLLPLLPIIAIIILIIIIVKRRQKKTQSAQVQPTTQQNDPTSPGDDQIT